MRLSPRVRGIAGLTSAITRLAANAAARVTSTETPRLHIPSSSGGGPGSARRRPACGRCSGAPARRRARAAGTRAGRGAQAPDVPADVEDAVPVARVAGADAIGQEVRQDDAGRRLVELLQRVDERARRRARRPDED